MTIKQHGGVFGRNPKFNNVEAESLSIAGNAVPDASTILVDSDIGSTVQGYDADTAKLDVAQTFTAAQTFNENIVMANGKGIDFSATGDAAGMDNELFDDYEEGEWTPTLTNLTVGNGSFQRAFYTKIGRLVHISFDFTFGSTTSATGGDIKVGGLPFTRAASGHGSAWLFDSGTARYVVPAVMPSSVALDARIASSTDAGDESLTDTKPFTWAASDRINFAMTYIAS